MATPVPQSFDPDFPPPRGEGRVAIFTRRRLTQKVYRGVFYEIEDVIAAIDDVDYHAPEVHRSKSLSLLAARVAHKVKNELGMTTKPPATLGPSTLPGKYELGFAIFAYPPDIPGIRSITNWKQTCRRTACYLAEHWPADFANPRQRAYLQLLSEFDVIFCHCPQTAELEALTGRPCIHLTVGIDALRFKPHAMDAPRPLEVYSMGRRSQVVHEALCKEAAAGKVFYIYDTTAGFDVLNWKDHRNLLAGNIRHSEFFISYKHNITLTSLTGGVEAVGARHFESAAGGSVPIGLAPDCDAFRENFDWPDAVIEMPVDCTHPLEFIQDLRKQPERLAAVRRNNVSNVLRRHDWSQRWKTVLQHLDMAPADKLGARETALARAHDELFPTPSTPQVLTTTL